MEAERAARAAADGGQRTAFAGGLASTHGLTEAEREQRDAAQRKIKKALGTPEGCAKVVADPKKLPTVKQYTSARHGPRDNDGFRWAPGAFRKYGVTKAEVILWLLKAGRDVCMSDVDAAWIAPPCAARLTARNSCAQFLVRTQVV